MWQGRGGPIGHVVTPNIPSSAIFSILPIWSPAPAGVTIMWRRHIESSFDYHEHYARVSPQWLRLQTMWSVTRLSQHPYSNIIAILLIWWMYLRMYIQFKASNWRKEDCNANGCKLQTHQQCSKMQPTQSLCSTYQFLKPEWENTVAWIFPSQIRIWEKLFSVFLKNNV